MITPFLPGPMNIAELRKQQRTKTGPVFPMSSYICAGTDYTSPEHPVPMPMFRRVFPVEAGLKKAELLINGLGLYEAHCNGKNITKGPLAPYRANPDHLVYFDRYDLTELLEPGVNVLAVLLGTGLQSSAHTNWKWSILPWRGPVQLAFSLALEYENGETVKIRSDSETKTAPSAIVFSDYHLGEYYDARLETPGWTEATFDDSRWQPVLKAPTPRGKPTFCEAEPIACFEELAPVSVTPLEGGYLYDFGVNFTGVCRLSITGEPGQKLVLQHFERLVDGKPFWNEIRHRDLRVQEDEYICRGGGTETWMPKFTYHGFRYVLVHGLREEQATPSLLRYVVQHSDLAPVGSFHCDNETVNRLQGNVLRADWSNFFYFPTDCPQREKHGWTADAALSAEQMLYNFDPVNSWREWLRNIYLAMTPEGGLPGIIPTGGTTYDWGNGPAWDQVIAELPYQAYRLRGDRKIVEEAAVPLMRYLTYLTTRRREDGLICFGLGDWCDVDAPQLFCSTPLVVTDSIMAVDIARKAAFLFGELGQDSFRRFALEFAASMTADIRRELIDHTACRVYGDTQTTQAMALYYGMFTDEEFEPAMEHLLDLIHRKNDHFATGVLGARVLFRLLAEHGYAELALNMIIREDPPSYGYLLTQDVTALWEEMAPATPPRGDDNHHFWGDISAWFYRYLGGIRPNPEGSNVHRLDIAPCFVRQVSSVSADYRMPCGQVRVSWQRRGDSVLLSLSVPSEAVGEILLSRGARFADGSDKKPLQSGEYTIFL